METSKETYYALLESPAWDEFRLRIIKEKNNTCEICGRQLKRGLQVHHLLYYADAKPWEYRDNEVQCLCVECHHKLHLDLAESKKKIPIYDKQHAEVAIPDELCCVHCGGKGIVPEFKWLGSICLYCFGTGYRGFHRYSPFEARRLASRMHNEWLSYKEDNHEKVDSGMPYTTSDLKKWILEINK